MEFRTLTADEIECRIAQIKSNGLSLLLYKDARVDQNILDESVGPMNWQKHYSRDNANCVVSIWDEDKKQWIEKEDTGTESNTEKEKGLASDSFKRACFNWGIGRELYSAPFIWITGTGASIANENGKAKCYDKFSVSRIAYDAKRRIVGLEIVNDSKDGLVVFRRGFTAEKPITKAEEPKEETKVPTNNRAVEEAKAKALVMGYLNRNNLDPGPICRKFKIASIQEMTLEAANAYINYVTEKGGNINE